MISIEILSITLEIAGIVLTFGYLLKTFLASNLLDSLLLKSSNNISNIKIEIGHFQAKLESLGSTEKTASTLNAAPLSSFHNLNQSVRVGAIMTTNLNH